MSAKVKIQDGNPIWMSESIIPSRMRLQSTQTRPAISAVNHNAIDVRVYVKVENAGTEDFGVCTCSTTGRWPSVTLFSGYMNNYAGATGTRTFPAPIGNSVLNLDLEGTTTGDFIQIGAQRFYFGPNPSKRWAWAWSPDGKLFAYVHSSTPYFPGNPSANPIDWNLVVVALDNITRYDGSTVSVRNSVCRHSGILNAPNLTQAWNNSNFGWAKSNAIIASGAFLGQHQRDIISPYSPNSKLENLAFTPDPDIEWENLVSPCGSMVACMPKKRTTNAPNTNFEFVSTRTGDRLLELKLFNRSIPIPQCTGSNPSITTVRAGAAGLAINTGDPAAPIISADEPDCTFIGGGVRVRVDRVKASTLPSGNLGVVGVGESASSVLEKGKYAWVEVPQLNNWDNQSEPHWCLLAQAYTTDGMVIPKPWNGQTAFPVSLENCAQRNIEIS